MSDGTANHDVESRGGLVAPKLAGGATLPFPPTPSASVAGRTLQESTYAQRVTPPRLHGDSPNIVIVLIDDAGPGLPTTFGGEVRTRDDGSDLRRRRQLQPVPHHCDVFADAGLAADRAKSSRDRQRADRRTGERLGRLRRADSAQQRAGGRGAQGLRLQHGRLGQVAQHPGGGHHGGRPVRGLAHRAGLRVFLRVPGGGGLAVRAPPGAQHHRRAAAEDPGGGLSPVGGPGRRRDRLAAQPQGAAGRSSHSSCTGPAAACTARTTS